MKEFNELINKTNDTRLKVYCNLTELMDITGMSIRALKYRMLVVKNKYKDVPSLLFKKNREWNIHYTIIREFEPLYNTKNKTVSSYNWVSMATWNPKFNYDINYHLQLIKEVKQQLPSNIITYTIETDNRGVNHAHIVSDADTTVLDVAITSTFQKYFLSEDEVRVKVEPIYNKYSALEYLKKASLASGTIK